LVKIRLQRHGRKQLPYYHIVVADSRARRDGRIIEDLGRYSPTEQPAMIKVNHARVVHWLNNGAQPSDTVRSILKKDGVMLRMHLTRWGKTEEEIEAAVAEFKAGQPVKGTSSSADSRARLKREEEQVAKEEAAAAEAARKAAAEAAAKAEADKKAAEEAAAVEAAATEEAVSEAPAEEATEAPAEEAPAAEASADADEATKEA
jgi:small subunit ribosomal protein S16